MIEPDFKASCNFRAACPLGAGAAKLLARRRGAAGNDHDPARQDPRHLHRAAVRRRGAAARRRLHRCPLRRSGSGPSLGENGARRARFQLELRGAAWSSRSMPASRSRCWRACTPAASSCSRASASAASLDLKGKSVGVQGIGSIPHTFLAVMAAYVGLDPVNDINWVTSPSVKPKELFADGKIDAFLGFPPEPQELRARNIGHVILNSAVDRPWSQYFCCLLSGSRDFVHEHPIATKRVHARHPQGHRPLRHRAGARRPDAGRWRVHGALRLRAPGADRSALRPLARVRPRGHAALLRAAAARGGHDHVQPQRRSSPRAPTGAS